MIEIKWAERPTGSGFHAFEWDYKNLFLQNKVDLNEGINDGDCLTLTNLVANLKAPRPWKILEIGSWKGGSTAIMAFAYNPDGVIYCVDTWGGSPGEWNVEVVQKYDVAYMFLRNMALMRLLDRVRMIKCTSHKASTLFPDNTFDLIFIDGDHRYEGVKQDLDDFYPKLKIGGIICGHDLNQDFWESPDMVDMVAEKDGANNHAGVSKTVYEKFGRDYKINREKGCTIWWKEKDANL